MDCTREGKYSFNLSNYAKDLVYTDCETWYPQACTFLYLKHRLHSHLEKSMIDRVMQYFKDRTGSFDDYYTYINNKKRNCNLQHIYNWKVFCHHGCSYDSNKNFQLSFRGIQPAIKEEIIRHIKRLRAYLKIIFL